MNTNTLPATILAAKEKFELACKDASALQIVSNFGAAFTAVNVIALLREAMTDEVMDKVFMPLMNTKIGFLTDRNGRARSGGRPASALHPRHSTRLHHRRGYYRLASDRKPVQYNSRKDVPH